MKAICSFILALAVSSAGAQIRPVEGLPLAVNYSVEMFKLAGTDFGAGDNPESVPIILRF